MRYNQIRRMDISNGPGIRVSLFTQGCAIHCDGCFNQESWPMDGGKPFTSETKEQLLTLCDRPQVVGLSILGGEPLLEQNIEVLHDLFVEFRRRFPNKTIWMWTGYQFEHLTPAQRAVVADVDVLVDGPWIQRLGDFKLKFRGSSNQRIIDVPRTLQSGNIVLMDELMK